MKYKHWKGGTYEYMGVSVDLGPAMDIANQGFLTDLITARDADTKSGLEVSVFVYKDTANSGIYTYYRVPGTQRVVYKDAAGQVWVRRVENFFGLTEEGEKRFVMEG